MLNECILRFSVNKHEIGIPSELDKVFEIIDAIKDNLEYYEANNGYYTLIGDNRVIIPIRNLLFNKRGIDIIEFTLDRGFGESLQLERFTVKFEPNRMVFGKEAFCVKLNSNGAISYYCYTPTDQLLSTYGDLESIKKALLDIKKKSGSGALMAYINKLWRSGLLNMTKVIV